MHDQGTISSFNFWMPIQKAGEVRGTDGQVYRRIKGIASTEDEDLQGESVDQRGIDTDYFLKHGYFNNDHKPGFENKVGFPTTARVTPKGLYVEGALFNDHKVADEIWNLMNAINATPGAPRKVGFSVQGKVKRRNGNRIAECWIQDIAITPAPINTATWAEIAKSLSKDEWEEKALTTGYAISGQNDGAALRQQSLDHDGKILTFDNKKMSKSTAVLYIQLVKGYSRNVAEKVASVVFNRIGV
jgi:hypothetical protein